MLLLAVALATAPLLVLIAYSAGSGSFSPTVFTVVVAAGVLLGILVGINATSQFIDILPATEGQVRLKNVHPSFAAAVTAVTATEGA